jgi:hypothetical protein
VPTATTEVEFSIGSLILIRFIPFGVSSFILLFFCLIEGLLLLLMLLLLLLLLLLQKAILASDFRYNTNSDNYSSFFSASSLNEAAASCSS